MAAEENFNKLKEHFIETNDVEAMSILMELQLDIFELQKQVEQAKHLSKLHSWQDEGRITFRHNAYFKGCEGPFCPQCWESEAKLVELTIGTRKNRTKGAAECPDCGTVTDISI